MGGCHESVPQDHWPDVGSLQRCVWPFLQRSGISLSRRSTTTRGSGEFDGSAKVTIAAGRVVSAGSWGTFTQDLSWEVCVHDVERINNYDRCRICGVDIAGAWQAMPDSATTCCHCGTAG